MVGSPFMPYVEDALQLVGAFISYSVARVARRGYLETRSPTLLRLTLAFALLGTGFVISGVSGLVVMDMLPGLAFLLSAFVVAAAGLETVGYFFLAFSHIIDVRGKSSVKVTPALFIPIASAAAALRSLSFYFLLYGVVETFISYFKTKRRETMPIALGLSLIFGSEFIRWLSLFEAGGMMTFISLLVKIIGFFALYIPVMQFSAQKERI